MSPVPLKQAVRIREPERDFELELDSELWPLKATAPPGWMQGPGYLYREIVETDDEKKVETQLAGPINESVLRFPSAPIHGLHRLHENHVNTGKAENFHTYRVLTHPHKFTRVRRIFLLHNGLNEIQSFSLYYRLASHLISQDPGGTACLLRPFPAHLSRSRFQRFAETPLDHYLWDGSNLFRQFFRYMIESQWLLSIVARRSTYRCISGLTLLAESERPPGSRLESEVLANVMFGAWSRLYDASKTASENARETQRNATSMKAPPKASSFLDAIGALRDLLQLDSRLGGDFDSHRREEPTVHVIGYSLGGFTAQSVFMSWPYLVSSCSTLLSGGALRELAPTAFADPEEWQTVLHSLRYELDEAMMAGRYRPEGNQVSGIDLDLFLYLKKTFYEVFQQEYRGSFQSRLTAFRRRMLFVVGGNDPIVRPKSVLDSGPPDGINMVSIGGLGHFLGAGSRDREEREQRLFWMPRLANLIAGLADDAATKLHEERSHAWLDHMMRLPSSDIAREEGDPPERDIAPPPLRLSVAERLAVDGDGALPATIFQRCLDDLISRPAAGDGLLFVLRNEIPAVLLDEDTLQQRAAALRHTDQGIADYIRGVRVRRQHIFQHDDRIRIILPWNVESVMKGLDARRGHPSQAEGAGGEMPRLKDPVETWEHFYQAHIVDPNPPSPELIRILDGRTGFAKGGIPKVKLSSLGKVARARLRTSGESRAVTPSLPDCWIWVSRQFLFPKNETATGASRGGRLGADLGREQLCEVVPRRYLKDPELLAEQLRQDQLRIVSVSRARYNPRFRGRIVADPDAARDFLLHATLCIAASVPLRTYDLARGRSKPRGSRT